MGLFDDLPSAKRPAPTSSRTATTTSTRWSLSSRACSSTAGSSLGSLLSTAAYPICKKESENVHSHAAPRTKAPRRKVGERLNLLSPVRGDTIIARVVCPGSIWSIAVCCFGEVLFIFAKAPGPECYQVGWFWWVTKTKPPYSLWLSLCSFYF